MRLRVLLSGSLVVLAAGCGGGGAQLPADYRGVDVPARTAAYVAPTPRPVPTALGGRTVPEDVVRGEVERLLVGQVRQPVTVSPVCDGSLRPDGTTRTVTCQVSWQGLRVPFEATVSGSGSPFYRVEVRQLRGVLLAAAVRDAWADERRSSERPLSCDAGIPAATLVPMDAATPHRCAVGDDVYTARIETQGKASRIAFDQVR